MPLDRPAASIADGGLPTRDLLSAWAGAHGSVLLYQPYLGPEEMARIDARAIPLDIRSRANDAGREYELFRSLDAHHRQIGLHEGVFWGLISTKFELKAVPTVARFVDRACEAQVRGGDAYLHNPMIGAEALYANVWEQALAGGHPGMEPIFEFLRAGGYGVDKVQGAGVFAFCNYVCGNARFWTGYMSFCETVLAALEDQARQGTAVGATYAGSGNYRDAGASMRPFVIERLLGLYLTQAMSQGLKIASDAPALADFEWKFGPRIGATLHRLHTLKTAFIAHGDNAALQAWLAERQPLLQQPQLVWHLDDPPLWAASR